MAGIEVAKGEGVPETQAGSKSAVDALVMHLAWLSEEQGKSFWQREDNERYLVDFTIYFKSKDQYITEQGWVAGTECWVCSLDVYNRVRVKVCRANIEDCLQEAVDRIKLYLSGDDKWWVGINQEQIDKVFGA